MKKHRSGKVLDFFGSCPSGWQNAPFGKLQEVHGVACPPHLAPTFGVPRDRPNAGPPRRRPRPLLTLLTVGLLLAVCKETMFQISSGLVPDFEGASCWDNSPAGRLTSLPSSQLPGRPASQSPCWPVSSLAKKTCPPSQMPSPVTRFPLTVDFRAKANSEMNRAQTSPNRSKKWIMCSNVFFIMTGRKYQ